MRLQKLCVTVDSLWVIDYPLLPICQQIKYIAHPLKIDRPNIISIKENKKANQTLLFIIINHSDKKEH